MAEAAYNLGVLLGGKGEYREAVLWCRRAAGLRPGDTRYADTLALYEGKLEADSGFASSWVTPSSTSSSLTGRCSRCD